MKVFGGWILWAVAAVAALANFEEGDAAAAAAPVELSADDGSAPVLQEEVPPPLDELPAAQPRPKQQAGVGIFHGIASALSFLANENLPPLLRNNFGLEKLTGTLLILAVTSALTGKGANRKVIQQLIDAVQPTVNARYGDKKVAATAEGKQNSSTTIHYIGWDMGESFASNDENRSYCLVRVRTHQRQCLWRRLFSKQGDTVEVELGGGLGKGPFTALVTRKVTTKAARASLGPLAGMAIAVKPQTTLPPAYVLLCDSNEVAAQLDFRKLCTVTKGLEKVSITDALPSSRFPMPDQRIIRATFRPNSPADLRTAVEELFNFAEAAATLQLSAKEKEKLQRTREQHLASLEPAHE